MREKITALLLHDGSAPMEILQAALARHGVATERARTCGEALLHLWSERPPHLLFTDAHLADGNWADVLAVARKSPAPVNVIVVSRQVDVSFYVEAIERGAFDFITPPLADAELAHVVRSAAEDVRHRRQRPSPAMPGGLGPEVMSR